MAKEPKSLFRRLSRLFKSGPIVKRKIRALDTTIAVADKTKSSGTLLFQKSLSPTYATITSNAYNLSERLMRYQDFQEMEYSLIESTQIAVPGGFKTIGELSSECDKDPNHTFIVYSYDHATQTIVPAIGKQARQTCVDETFEVKLDSGKSITASGEHRLMLRDGSYRKVKDLVVGDAMMPFCRESECGYEEHRRVYTMQKERPWVPEHVLFSELVSGKKRDNDQPKRNDVTFAKILQTCDELGFNQSIVSEALCANLSLIRARLAEFGFANFEVFAKTYDYNLKNDGVLGVELTYKRVCDAYEQGMSRVDLAKKLGTSINAVMQCLRGQGFDGFSRWVDSYHDCKVVGVKSAGIQPLYDLTVDGYKNFATDSVVSHNTPEIAAAMDIYADETCAQDEKGRILHVYSDNERVRELLEDLFYNVLNVEFNLRSWARNLCKYGDFFLYNDVSPEYGVINAFPIPVNEIEREENYDRDDPFAVRYRWVTLGNRTLENWEVTHFRLLGNDMFLPYGSSIIEPARRIWRQLILIEDAMLVYRVVRAPERRVFYIDVANLPPGEVNTYIEQQRQQMRTTPVVDRTTGRVDLRYNPMCLSLDTGIKIRDAGTLRLGDLISEWNAGKRNQWVYSFDAETKKYVPGKVTWAGITRRNAELVRVTLDDGSSLDVTPDHRFMLLDGMYQRADELQHDQPLMPSCAKKSSKVDGVERLRVREDTGCINVERWHNFAAGSFDESNNESLGYVMLHNSVEEDFFIPIRGGETGTKIDTLAGGQNTAAVEDVAYIQKKLFAALKIPRAYLGYDEMLSCLRGNTNVALLDGSTQTIETLAKSDCKDVWVYSIDNETGNVVPGKVNRVWKTKDVTQFHRIMLDDGTTFDVTENHPFMMRDGSYKRADELKICDSLMPLYRRTSSTKKKGGDDELNGYEMVLDKNCEWKYTHRLVSEAGLVSDDPSRKLERSYVVHHVDCNKRNNSPINLLKMGRKAHALLHSKGALSNLLSESSRDKLREVMKTEKYLTAHVNGVKYAWDNDDGSRREAISNNNSKYKQKNVSVNELHEIAKKCSDRNDFMCKLLDINVSWSCFRNNLTRNGINISQWLVQHFGGYPRGTRPRLTYTIEQLTEFCVKNNVTSMTDWKRLGNVPFCGSVVKRIIKENGYATFIDFKKTLKNNHKVLSVEIITVDEPIAVYDLEVEKYHNFAISDLSLDGFVFVHNSKATLAQEDIRFSRTTNVIQKTITAELNKLAIIHLYAHGFDNEDLQNFTLHLSNPSTVAQQQKLELWRAKFEIAGSAPEGMASKKFIRKEIWGLNDEQIKVLDTERLEEKQVNDDIEGGDGGFGGGGTEGGAEGLFGGGGGEESGGGGEESGAGEEATPAPENAGDEPEEETNAGVQLLTGSDDLDDDESFSLKLPHLYGDVGPPIKAQSQLQRSLYNRGRRRHHGSNSTATPDLNKMTSNDNEAMGDPYDNNFINSMVSNPFGESVDRIVQKPRKIAGGRLPNDTVYMLRKMTESKAFSEHADEQRAILISEGTDVQDEIDSKSNAVINEDLRSNGAAPDEPLINESVLTIDGDADFDDDSEDE